jgi:hypothetical protein
MLLLLVLVLGQRCQRDSEKKRKENKKFTCVNCVQLERTMVASTQCRLLLIFISILFAPNEFFLLLLITNYVIIILLESARVGLSIYLFAPLSLSNAHKCTFPILKLP